MLQKKLISSRYRNDAIPLLNLNEIQKEYIQRFIDDNRMVYNKVDSCPLCDHKTFFLISEKDRYGIPLETVICEKCGLIFSHKQMSVKGTTLFYSEYYRRIYDGYEFPSIDFLKTKYESIKLRNIPRFLKQNGVVVEIGTSGGWNLMRYKIQGYKHIGFDYDKRYVNFGRTNYDLNLYHGGIESAIEKKIKADLIILSHVLEHTVDPIEFLEKEKLISHNKTILRIGVPPADYLILTGSTIGHDLLGTLQNAHNFLFDRFTLRYLVSKAGFKIISSFPGDILITPTLNHTHALSEIEKKLDKKFRGDRVLNYLRLCEKLVKYKDRFISNSQFNLQFLNYMIFPLQLLKRVFLYKYDIRM